MTLILPLGWFIVVMIAMYFVFSRPHTVPGHQAISGAKPVSPGAAAPSVAAATGFPTATGSGGTEPLADRDTPPAVGAASEGDTAVETPADEGAADKTASDEAADTGKSEGTE